MMSPFYFAKNFHLAAFLALVTALAMVSFAVLAAPPQAPPEAVKSGKDIQPGDSFHLFIKDLPKPFATPSVANPPGILEGYGADQLKVPEGFSVALFASNLDAPRTMLATANGDVFVTQRGSGEITVLRDSNNDGQADTRFTFAKGFSAPYGMVISDNWLYVADRRRIWRLPYRPGETTSRRRQEAVTARGSLASGDGHWTRNLALDEDGRRLYVTIGSASNLSEEKAPRASVKEFTLESRGGKLKEERIFAHGLRNPVGIAFYPGTGDLYVTVNERDGQGDGLVPDYFTRIKEGGFYGWPYAYLGPNPQPGYASRNPQMVEKTLTPDVLFRAHSAPLDFVFYEGTDFPQSYRGDAFVALHGSWNAAKPQGYMVARVPFEKGRPMGQYQVFMSGFWVANEDRAQVMGRPAGLAVMEDGSLLVSDDTGGRIWRVSFDGAP